MKDVNVKDLQLYRETMASLYVLVNVLFAAPLDELDEVTRKAESIGPIVEPTIWRNNAQSIAEDRHVVKVLARAARELAAGMKAGLPESAKQLIRLTTDALHADDDVDAALERALKPHGHPVPPMAVLCLLIEKIARLGIQAHDASKASQS